jgi:hypothetical protein
MSFNVDLPARQELLKTLKLDEKKLKIFLSNKEVIKGSSRMCVLFEDQLTESQLVQLVMYRDLRHIIQNSVQSAVEKVEFLNGLVKDNRDY